MKLPWLKILLGFLLATILIAPAWAADQALPGSLNYIEGQATIAGETVGPKSIGSVALEPGQTLSTGNGKVEILLTPGVFLRVGDNSTVKMVSTNLTNTEADLVKGQATVEVAEIHPYNQLRVDEGGTATYLQKDGLYAFDADLQQVRVLKGEALVQDNDQQVKVKAGHELDLNGTGHLKAAKFDKNAFEASDLYRFSALRSAYLSEANVDIARQYYAGNPGWYGPGWYWNPWYWSYTWLPGDGIFYSPFGWGFYSPLWVGYAPVYYRHYPYRGSYGFFPIYARTAAIPPPGHAPGAHPSAAMPAPRGNSGVSAPAFHSSGSFHGGGFSGGGFHH